MKIIQVILKFLLVLKILQVILKFMLSYSSFRKEILNYIQSNNEFYTDRQVLQAETEMQIYI